MTYRDNDVFFSPGSGCTIVSVSYTVTDYSITSGQDPDRKIQTGRTFYGDSSGKLRFSIGRKASSSVANWFNARTPGSQNTFNQNAGELNFALYGVLRMTVKGGILGGRQRSFTFPSVTIAQGSSGTSNNWWFGGQTGTYVQNNQLSHNGTDQNGGPVAFLFRRGGNDVSTVAATPLFLIDTPNWMSRLSDGLRLDQIMMPGSHDAGMSELSHCAPLGIRPGLTQTQSGSVAQQLIDGSRYFDIRVDYDYGALVTYHRTGANGCNGQSFRAVLDQARAFLQAHPRETAIFKISHIRQYDGHDPAATKQMIANMLNEYRPILYQNASAAVNLAELTLGSIRGKLILVFDYPEYIYQAGGFFRYMDGNSVQSGANMTVYDSYTGTTDYATMKADQLQKWTNYGGTGRGYLFLLSWTLTGNMISDTIADMANPANEKLATVLYDKIIGTNAPKPNIVYVDFMNSAVAQGIILFNY